MKTFLIVIGLFCAGAVWALPQSPSQRAQLFATCAGRYSALVEHQRLFDGVASEQAEDQKKIFETLLEAVMPHALAWGMPGHMALDWRLTAKHAQAQLLQKGAFQTDDDIARRSRHVATALLSDCHMFVLGA